MENAPSPGGKISANVIWGENMKREERKMKVVKEKGRKGTEENKADVKVQNREELKGQCHEIFLLCFFSSNIYS